MPGWIWRGGSDSRAVKDSSPGRAGSARRRLIVKAVLWTAFLTPAVVLAVDGLTGRLGANPIEETIHRTGWWTLFLLTGTLAITPARRLTGSRQIIRYRRLVGLFAFFYGTLHFSSYVVLDQFFAWDYILEDIAERPFITLGFGAWLILLALAFTSTRGWIRRLGRRWRRLHRLVYVAALAGGVHFFWRVKADEREPLVFLAVIICLLAVRVVIRARGGAGTSRRTATEAT